VNSKSKVVVLIQDLGTALIRLADALKQPEDEFIRDAAIQRFEFCFELSWKSIQAVARLEGQNCPSPRMAVSMAWQNRWLADESIWLDMLEEWNRTSHTARDHSQRGF
jgi:nucleotidyltransferase substrate binding protein (TIGR01987 family)